MISCPKFDLSIQGFLNSDISGLNVLRYHNQSVLRNLSDSGYLSWAAVPEGGVSPETLKEDSPVAVVLGNEPRGLNEETIKACNGRLSVPTVGLSDSLNVAVAGSIILYSLSQRH